MRVLLVEDDRLIGEGLVTALRQDGYSVDWLRDGQAASDALRAERFDLVLLDLGLPHQVEALRAQREALRPGAAGPGRAAPGRSAPRAARRTPPGRRGASPPNSRPGAAR